MSRIEELLNPFELGEYNCDRADELVRLVRRQQDQLHRLAHQWLWPPWRSAQCTEWSIRNRCARELLTILETNQEIE